ncbi:hypothetical protein RCL_jg16424.t1 [Rhizophagus clarus]|uniref:Uncharacterized protein n=1 Tax=Rhizophagus clarus TaxID=94130 RepID=A0A8H3R2U7_9GLOM|nr:hypothetical protein RCL_jg16424.t1 [Rhizophagus clarus]
MSRKCQIAISQTFSGQTDISMSISDHSFYRIVIFDVLALDALAPGALVFAIFVIFASNSPSNNCIFSSDSKYSLAFSSTLLQSSTITFEEIFSFNPFRSVFLTDKRFGCGPERATLSFTTDQTPSIGWSKEGQN